LASGSSERGPGPALAGYPEHLDAVRLSAPEFAADPAALYRVLRERHGPVAPVLLDGDVPAWLVLGYREVLQVTSQPEVFGRDCRRWNAWHRIPVDWPLMPYLGWTVSVRFTEGAEHSRRAEVLSDALDAVDPARLQATAERVADHLIDAFARDGTADLIGQYAQQVPIRVLTTLFGLPGSAVPGLVRDIAGSLDAGPAAVEANQRLHRWVQQLVTEAQDRPGPATASRLLGHPAGLTADQAVTDILVMTVAGQQPTADWIGSTLRRMLVDDEFSVALQGGRATVADALNAVLWSDPPVRHGTGRWAASDQELGGRQIRRGDLLILGLAAANSDPQAHPGAGAESGVNRAHLAFGHGEHGCPSPAPELAAIIAKSAVEVLLDRLPDVRLAVAPGALRWRPSPWLRGLASLPAQFTPVAPAAPLSPAAPVGPAPPGGPVGRPRRPAANVAAANVRGPG